LDLRIRVSYLPKLLSGLVFPELIIGLSAKQNKPMSPHRKFIFICNGSDCKKAGCKKLHSEIKGLIKSEDNKGKYKLIKTKCMDFCKSAPSVIMQNELIKKADLEVLKGRMK
jgi:NADH:ubiquinone oxidoreductase subunit E